MTNSQYYSDLYSTTHITVSIIEQDFGRQINFMYDPPPLLWVFHNRTSEDLEQELNIAMQEFISVAYKKDTGIFIKAKMEQILNHWIYAGWLTLDTHKINELARIP